MFWEKKKDKKVNEKLPDSLSSKGIRVSTPYGAYPEDVDAVILDLEEKIKSLTTQNDNLIKKNEQLNKDLHIVNTELAKMRIDVSLMTIPETTAEEDSKMLSELNKITSAEDDDDFGLEVVGEE